MKQVYALIMLVLFLANQTVAKEFDYQHVAMAGTGNVGNLFVRYLLSLNESCLIIQNLVPGGRGTVSAEKEICSLNGKNFDVGFAALDFKQGVFKDGKLIFEIGVTPLEPIGETVMSCEVIFYQGIADRLSCNKREYIEKEDCKCKHE